MLTEVPKKLVSVFVTLAIFGIIFGNSILLTMGLIPVFVLVMGLVITPTDSVEINRKIEKSELYVNESLEIEIEIELEEGTGPLIIGDQIPEEFELVEGSNFKVMPEPREDRTEKFSYKIKCTRRGNYELGPTKWESRDVMGLRQVISGTEENKTELRVKPRLLDPRKMRGGTSASSIPLPSGSISKFGIPTMDFKELREYSPRDPFKKINWKATARNSTEQDVEPMVNEYEKEGKKQVWIYLDQSKRMNLGKTTANVFEYALDAVNTLSYYYLNEGCMVGFVPYNSLASVITPETGKTQYLKILRKLMDIDARKASTIGEKYELPESVSKNRVYMSGFSPFSVIVTRITERNQKEIRNGIKEITKGVQSKRREKIPVMLINIFGYSFSADSREKELAGKLLEIEDSLILKDIKDHVIWLDWNPAEETFTSALLRRARRR